jgi:hypothetical protein
MKHDAAKTAWRGAGSERWTTAEDALLIEARGLGFRFGEIAILLNRDVGEGAISARLAKLQDAAEAIAEEQRHAARLKPRLCLRCRAVFPSEGAHNRMCDPCRAGAANVSPFALDGCAIEDDDE